MTLEDFFTLSEMKDGLAALDRVEVLLSVIQNQKDCVKGVVGDAARQWTTVANILAITENRDCLDHFMQLNGVSFLSNWLHEAQKCSDDNSDCCTEEMISALEELISALLRALDRLPVNKEKLSASGVGVTVELLHDHMSQSIQEKAKTLCDEWKQVGDNDLEHHTVDENGPACDDGNKHSTETISVVAVLEISPSDKVSDENAKTSSNNLPADSAQDVKVSSNQICSNSSERNEVSGEMNTVASSHVVNPCEENLSVKESVCPEAGVTSTSPCGSPVSRGRNIDEPLDISDGKDTSDGPEDMDIEVNMKEVSPCKTSEKEMLFTSAEASFCKKGDIGRTNESKGDEGVISKVDKGVESKISSALRSSVNSNTVSEMDKRGSEIGLEYGEIEPLEVARQVAIEVEREVVDYREPFCSSPEVISRDEIMESCSFDLADNKNDKPVGEQLSGNESPIRKGLSVNSSPRKSTRTTKDVDVKNFVPDPESPKSTSVLESVGNMDKNRCGFDLNEDVCSRENDSQMVPTANQTINLSAPIHVAASKGAPSLPVISLHFEGELGWRGSAATSAFRPASPRRTSDGEKTACGPKQKINFPKIDLNVAEGEDDVSVDHPSNKHALSSCISLDKSSTETSSRVERLELDLNRIGDDDTLLNQSSHWRPSHQNGNCSPSPASSSSSRQPSMRDFDLNDNPSLFDACGPSTAGKSSSKETSTYGSYKFDDPVITIMGSRMSVERKEPVSQTLPPFLGNGLGMDSAIRAPSAYPPMPPHAYGYHGLQMGPPLPIPQVLYGPGSIYMVDSRGATVIPQILGSAGLSGATPSRPPFLTSVAGAPSGLNIVGSVSRPSLDLNSGTTPAEGGNKEIRSFKQLFMQGNSGLVEDHMTSASQPAGSGMVLKRKEPDCGWETNPFGPGYKQATSWQ